MVARRLMTSTPSPLHTRSRATLAAVFAGGVLGGLARAGVGAALPHDPGAWPWATLLANVAGAFVLGAVATGAARRLALSPRARTFLGAGFCGALTTFSTFQVEIFDLLDAGRGGLALLYAAVSVGAGLAAVAAAPAIARRRA